MLKIIELNAEMPDQSTESPELKLFRNTTKVENFSIRRKNTIIVCDEVCNTTGKTPQIWISEMVEN